MHKGIVAFLAIVAMSFAIACCGNEKLCQFDSPDNSMSVVVTVRDCGACDRYAYTVATLKSNRIWDWRQRTVLTAKYEQQVEVNWKSNSEVVISCAGCKRNEWVGLQKPTVGAVNVSYKTGLAALSED